MKKTKLKFKVEVAEPKRGGLDAFEVGDIVRNSHTEAVYLVGCLEPEAGGREKLALFELDTGHILTREHCVGWTLEKIPNELTIRMVSR